MDTQSSSPGLYFSRHIGRTSRRSRSLNNGAKTQREVEYGNDSTPKLRRGAYLTRKLFIELSELSKDELDFICMKICWLDDP